MYSQRQTSRHDDELGTRILQRGDRLLHDPVVREALEPHRILRGRDPEEQNGLDPERRELSRFAREAVDRELVDPRHRRHRLPHVLSGNDEERIDEVVGRERGLANEVSQRRRSAKPARTVGSGFESKRVERAGFGELGHGLSTK